MGRRRVSQRRKGTCRVTEGRETSASTRGGGEQGSGEPDLEDSECHTNDLCFILRVVEDTKASVPCDMWVCVIWLL